MQLPREPLLTAETQHLLGDHRDAFQLMGTAGHQERRRKFCGGEAQGMPDSGVAQNVSIPTGVSKLLPFAPTSPHLPPPEGSRNGLVHQLLFPCSLASLLLLPLDL